MRGAFGFCFDFKTTYVPDNYTEAIFVSAAACILFFFGHYGRNIGRRPVTFARDTEQLTESWSLLFERGYMDAQLYGFTDASAGIVQPIDRALKLLKSML